MIERRQNRADVGAASRNYVLKSIRELFSIMIKKHGDVGEKILVFACSKCE